MNNKKLPFCQCGCGNRVTKIGNKFIHNHHGGNRGYKHPGINSKSKITLICQQCKKEFDVQPCDKNRKFCSKICFNKSQINKNRGKDNPNYKPKITLICQQCGNEFKVILSRKNAKFCSNKCRGKWLSENNSGKNNSCYGKTGKLSPFYKGQDLVRHHYIYDDNDLSKYTMLVTRKQHPKIHKWLKKSGIIIPHINR